MIRTDTLTLAEIARRQARYVHLCAVLNVQDRPDTGDGYTAEDWERAREDERAAEDARMARQGLG